MSKRSKHPPKPVAPTDVRPRRAWRVLMLLAALLLTAVGACQGTRLWLRLPDPSVAMLDWDEFYNRRANIGGHAREGFVLAGISDFYTEALHEPESLSGLLQSARQLAAQAPDSQLPRLQLAALTMLQLERDDVPAGEWWPRLRIYLEGLERADFDHFQRELLDAQASVYVNLGVPPGTARRTALRSMGYRHGPFLQYFTSRMHKLVADSHAADDRARAAQCERVLCRLLRSWTLAPGPPGLRLLAADLLARTLDLSETWQLPPNADAIAADLRGWRNEYRERAARLELPVSALRVDSEPAPADAGKLVVWLSLSLWTAGALIVLMPIGLLTSVFWLNRPAPRARRTLVLLLSPVPALVLVALGGLYLSLFPEVRPDDLLRLSQIGWDVHHTQRLGLPRIPIIAAAVTALLLALSAFGARRREAGPTVWNSAGFGAVVAWLGTSVVLLVLVVGAETMRRGYESQLAVPPHLLIESVAGHENDARLDGLRAWNP